METITINVYRDDVYDEVAKATDYTGSKLMDGDEGARERILAGDAELADLGRLWDESALAANESLKEMLVSGQTGEDKDSGRVRYEAKIEVSLSFDKGLAGSVESALRSYFVASVTGQWFKYANKGEAADYFGQAAEWMESAKRMLYSRRKPRRPAEA